MITEEKNNEFHINVPECPHCKRLMGGFFYEFYKDPNFNMTESLGAFFWTKIWFQCPKCLGKAFLTETEIDKMNSYPLDKINFPPGFDTKKMKVTRLTSK